MQTLKIVSAQLLRVCMTYIIHYAVYVLSKNVTFAHISFHGDPSTPDSKLLTSDTSSFSLLATHSMCVAISSLSMSASSLERQTFFSNSSQFLFQENSQKFPQPLNIAKLSTGALQKQLKFGLFPRAAVARQSREQERL